jgi:hypothetical protein
LPGSLSISLDNWNSQSPEVLTLTHFQHLTWAPILNGGGGWEITQNSPKLPHCSHHLSLPSKCNSCPSFNVRPFFLPVLCLSFLLRIFLILIIPLIFYNIQLFPQTRCFTDYKHVQVLFLFCFFSFKSKIKEYFPGTPHSSFKFIYPATLTLSAS